MRIAALIQARMGSTRLPGKVMMDVEGRPVLGRVLDQVRCCKKIDQVVVATTVNLKDDAVVDFCAKEKVAYFRGSENDVLDRYFQAAMEARADHIVRITSDCPLIAPDISDQVITKHLREGADYTSNTLEGTYPRGWDIEIFTYHAIARAVREARDPAEKEHVTPYFYRHPELFKLASVEAIGTFHRPDIRICVDTQEDLDLIRKIYQELKSFPIKKGHAIIDLFDRKPELLKINASIRQKSV